MAEEYDSHKCPHAGQPDRMRRSFLDVGLGAFRRLRGAGMEGEMKTEFYGLPPDVPIDTL